MLVEYRNASTSLLTSLGQCLEADVLLQLSFLGILFLIMVSGRLPESQSTCWSWAERMPLWFTNKFRICDVSIFSKELLHLLKSHTVLGKERFPVEHSDELITSLNRWCLNRSFLLLWGELWLVYLSVSTLTFSFRSGMCFWSTFPVTAAYLMYSGTAQRCKPACCCFPMKLSWMSAPVPSAACKHSACSSGPELAQSSHPPSPGCVAWVSSAPAVLSPLLWHYFLV